MLDSFDLFPEYAKPLGQPLGPPTNASAPAPPLAPWTPLQNQNLAYGWPQAPSAAGNVPGQLAFLGLQPTFAACLAQAQANASFTAVTWAGSASAASEWRLTCWGRLGSADWGACLDGEVVAPPCYAAVDSGAVSAVRDAVQRTETVWRRSFEKVNVTWWPSNGSAVMEGW